MEDYKTGSLNAIIEEAVKDNWERESLTDMGGQNYLYKDVAINIEKLHLIFEAAGVKAGDMVAICGKNSANWAVTFIACLTAGVVAVPILHEFKPDTIHHLVNHSDAKLFFVDAAIWENLDEKQLPALIGALYIAEYGMPLSRSKELTEARNNINALFGKKYPYDFTKEDISYYKDSPEELCLINYTSGSTGMSKGVMLPYRSIWSNIRYCLDNLPWLVAGDGMVNMLPLAHLYGMVIEMLHPFCKGCHCHFLTKAPSPKIILGAFAEVKPKLIITVPLILEKIIRTKVFPMLDKPLMKVLLKLPFIDEKLLAKVKEGLTQAFGGQVQEIIVGGAGINKEVADFLFRIGFPFTVGYGMTECGPLITYSAPAQEIPGTVGRVVSRMEAKVESDDPANIAGDMWVRGCNVMLGYYKNEKATLEVMPEGPEGWMNTGDLCKEDAGGNITICGRSKTMILGPSGQNIYPEEIEQKLNMMPYVNECLVIDDGGRLATLVYPDFDAARHEGLGREDIEKQMDDNLKHLNSELPSYSKVSRLKIMDEEFEKTPKKSIKRFLYQP